MRDLIFEYIFRPLARPVSQLVVRLAALPALHFLFRHVHRLDRLNHELEKDLAEWFRGSLLLLLVTANMEVWLWHNLIPFQQLLDKHQWLGLGLRIMLAIGVVQMMPDQELFALIHPGPRLPQFCRDRSRWEQLRDCWKPFLIGFSWQHLGRSSPVFAILAVIFDGTAGWACYAMAILQYLIIGLVTSRDRAIDVLTVFDAEMAARRHELVRQYGVIDEFTRHEEVFEQEDASSRGHSSCGD